MARAARLVHSRLENHHKQGAIFGKCVFFSVKLFTIRVIVFQSHEREREHPRPSVVAPLCCCTAVLLAFLLMQCTAAGLPFLRSFPTGPHPHRHSAVDGSARQRRHTAATPARRQQRPGPRPCRRKRSGRRRPAAGPPLPGVHRLPAPRERLQQRRRRRRRGRRHRCRRGHRGRRHPAGRPADPGRRGAAAPVQHVPGVVPPVVPPPAPPGHARGRREVELRVLPRDGAGGRRRLGRGVRGGEADGEPAPGDARRCAGACGVRVIYMWTFLVVVCCCRW